MYTFLHFSILQCPLQTDVLQKIESLVMVYLCDLLIDIAMNECQPNLANMFCFNVVIHAAAGATHCSIAFLRFKCRGPTGRYF